MQAPSSIVLKQTDGERAARENANPRAIREQFEQLVQVHRAKALSTAWRLLGGDQAAAEDVVQDAFLRAHRALPSFRGSSTLHTWFFRILLRQISNRRRWLALRSWWPLSNEHEWVDPSPASMTDHGLRRRIVAALFELSQSQRTVFVLIHLEGFTVVETAEILGNKPGTVKSHLHRALKRLRESLHDLKDENLAVEKQ